MTTAKAIPDAVYSAIGWRSVHSAIESDMFEGKVALYEDHLTCEPRPPKWLDQFFAPLEGRPLFFEPVDVGFAEMQCVQIGRSHLIETVITLDTPAVTWALIVGKFMLLARFRQRRCALRARRCHPSFPAQDSY